VLLLVVVAHPDDESFGCGSVLAHAATAGYATAVLCATRGEAGESRIRTDDLAAVREAELREASRILGVATIHLLDYRDSGMTGEPAPETLARARPERVVAEVRSVIDELRPDVVVTLDGSDGHRDHVAIREATIAAVDTANHPPGATYLWCLARSSMAKWASNPRGGRGDEYLELGTLGTPDEQITTRIDVASHLPQRWRAIRAHASQTSPYDDLPAELQHEFLAVDRLRLVRGDDRLATRDIPGGACC
jgi:N-acetyl-1-D-myo-inositol-2-amino-2-deoxy-alpha-D-glucopyranoside deacetylase